MARIAEQSAACEATELHLSVGSMTTALDPKNLSRARMHENYTGERPDEKVKWMVNRILGPLARAASKDIADDDLVWAIHEKTRLTGLECRIMVSLLEPAVGLVIEHPLQYGDVLEYHSRCLLFRGDAFKKFYAQPIPEDEVVTQTSVQYIMKAMDEAGARYKFTQFNFKQD